MEALRDRTVKIDVPYITRLDQEVRIYQKDFNAVKIPHVHIAPHIRDGIYLGDSYKT